MNKKTWKIFIDKLPPSKNLLYYGSSYKNAYRDYILKNNENARNFASYVASLNGYGEFDVRVVFFIPENRYKKFEPQNYIEVLFDVIFGEERDNRVKSFCVAKHPIGKNEKPHLIIFISAL